MDSPGPSRLRLPPDMVPYHSESYSRALDPCNHAYDHYDDSEAREHARSISDSSSEYPCISRSPEDLNRHGERFPSRHNSYSEPPQERNHTTHNETRRTLNYSLPSDYASLREENIVLRTENSMLKATNQSLMSLLSQGPLTSISTNPLMCPAPNRSTLHENDYPKVKYLQRSKWTKAVDKRRGISGGDIISRNSLAFIEDSDGRAPTDAKITEMRKWCYSFFFELQKKRTAPAVWGQVSLSAQGDFRAGAECEFFNLALGDGHWKADQLATIVFPSWNGTHGTGAKVKEELISGDEEDDDEVIEVSKSRKRASAAPGAPAAKRLRPDSTLSPSQSKKAKKDGTRKKRKNPLLGRTPETSTELLTPLQPSTEPIAPVPLESVPAPTVDSIPSSTTTVSLNTLDSSLPATSAALSVDPALVAPRTTPTASPHRIPIPPPVATVSSLVQTVDAPPNTTGPIPLAPSPSKLRSPIVPALPDRSAGFAAVAGSSSLNTVPTKKKKWNPSGTSTTARALCAMWYKNQHGSKADAESFKTYWDKLSPEEKNPWITREANAKSAVAALNLASGSG